MTNPDWKTVGETLIDMLEANDVEVVFGIPGVHTVELYRGLAASRLRHVTPRHEQGAGFMADGYARVSGKPGVCLVISGPGLTNIITAMAQAFEDSIPMLVISAVNAKDSLGKGRGELHELPNQSAMIKTLVKYSYTLLNSNHLQAVIDRAFVEMGTGRPGPVHIEIPTDIMMQKIAPPVLSKTLPAQPQANHRLLAKAAALCMDSVRPLILAGGGCRQAEQELARLAMRLDAPVVTTINARDLLADHDLHIPASPSLEAVRRLVACSDLVIAIGTQMGPTDYDMYKNGNFPEIAKLIRIDIDEGQLARGPKSALKIASGAQNACRDLAGFLPVSGCRNEGTKRAAETRSIAFEALDAKLKREIAIVETIGKSLPGCIIVGDSTQLIYAANLYCTLEKNTRWFNSATGFGTLGYAPPAAIGASLAAPERPVVCIVGDGGIQFSLAELGSAMDEKTPVIFIVWNNLGYQEIENHMVASDIEPTGVKPSPPDFQKLAQAYGLGRAVVQKIAGLPDTLKLAAQNKGPFLIEIDAWSPHSSVLPE